MESRTRSCYLYVMFVCRLHCLPRRVLVRLPKAIKYMAFLSFYFIVSAIDMVFIFYLSRASLLLNLSSINCFRIKCFCKSFCIQIFSHNSFRGSLGIGLSTDRNAGRGKVTYNRISPDPTKAGPTLGVVVVVCCYCRRLLKSSIMYQSVSITNGLKLDYFIIANSQKH